MGETPSVSTHAGGCDFPVDPSLEADRAQVWWRPEVDAELIELQATSHDAVASGATPGWRLLATDLDAAGRARWSSGHGQQIRLALRGEHPDPRRPLEAVVPLDAATPARLRALDRLARHLEGRKPPPDPITRQRRRRMAAMLRALDARASGAVYREIASVLFGAARVAAEPWKTSSIRDATLRLVRDGGAMAQGGYLSLLGAARVLGDR
ncbi:DUF2285 domain-containing protein [Caulobacter sp. RHG1]|uniref:DUF2285 domain-containing protein n=1 Tax=Caulobacter sp. (strain RHG1) TaxID=2545762 RepID=UPI0015566C0E